jgi:hypothetical protein
MAEPEAEAAWRAELERMGETQPREAQNSDRKLKRQAHFVGRVMKPKRGGSRRSTLTTMSGGPSSLQSVL